MNVQFRSTTNRFPCANFIFCRRKPQSLAVILHALSMYEDKPNIFRWATSELSQDAFICWLLSWATVNNDKDIALSRTAQHFIWKLTQHRVTDILTIEIEKQYKNIDIVVRVNGKYAILIEDKTHTKNHSGQLERYYQSLSTSHLEYEIIPVYFKTGDQCDYNEIKQLGYFPFLRKDFIEVLDFGITNGVKSEIFQDYHSHLLLRERAFQSYTTLTVDKWSHDSWKGFYTELALQLREGSWDYVPQKNGGFMGFWWYWRDCEIRGKKFKTYLQLEEAKLCFKIVPNEIDDAEEVRKYYRPLLFENAMKYGVELYQNGRIGKYMTVAALTQQYLQTDSQGCINLDGTVNLLRQLQNITEI
jgi:hypothetical protein